MVKEALRVQQVVEAEEQLEVDLKQEAGAVYACIESLYRYKSLILHCILISYYISVVIVNDSMEFLLLPVSKGYRSVRDFRRCVRDAPPDGAAFTFACICI